MDVECVIYDCDGVLFDSLEVNEMLYNDLCSKAGRHPLRQEELAYVHAHTVFEAMHYLFGHEEKLEKRAMELFKQIDLREYIPFLKMEPHLLETLTRLKEAGILRAISTNRTTSMPFIMERFNLDPFFDMVVTALDVKNPKPHRESIDKIIDGLNLDRSKVVFVGDSEVDRQTAESAGVTFVAYKNKEIRADTFIDDHLALLAILSVSDSVSVSAKKKK